MDTEEQLAEAADLLEQIEATQSLSEAARWQRGAGTMVKYRPAA